mmetsp:Transcript_10780/g.25071  ORF Transcript_10780/g.25071 Transcript_10780/m.25071 type:complete len:174 (-) Transcript_10780:93-614(-)
MRVVIKTRDTPLCPRLNAARGVSFSMEVEPKQTIRSLKVAIQALVKGSPVKEMCLHPDRLVIMSLDDEVPSALADHVQLHACGIVDGELLRLTVKPTPAPDHAFQPDFDNGPRLVPFERAPDNYPHRIHRKPADDRRLLRDGGSAELKDSFAKAETEQLARWAEQQIETMPLS